MKSPAKKKTAKPKAVSMESLKSFVRKIAPEYLKRDDITSVGIGYKVQNGKPTREISIQFSVGEKRSTDILEALGEESLPESFVVDGTEVKTDVIERSYEHSAREISPRTKIEGASERKASVDPVVPGVSIGHPSISAGTAGCVVYDVHNGRQYVLSNWHVLHGAEGSIGDNIVQPGKHDDNRIDRNLAGRLIRSHLGVAGDCAIAEINNRKLEATILDLNSKVQRIGEPELGDRVVKSGRTTDVTYGVVNRIHTTAKIFYNGVGECEIGCFEIGPDPKKPAKDGEISMGGDSGAAWLHVADNKASDMMLGLHFAGETGDAPEHALACYAASVFEKLEILPAVPQKLEISATEAVKGYQLGFIGAEIAAPTPNDQASQQDLLEVNGKTVFDHMHFSLAMSVSRKLSKWVAWNIDGGSLRKLSRNGIRFKKDPNLPKEAQIGDELYANNPLDRGHIARRADLLWGSLAEAKRANIDSFFFTNIAPQHEAFNQSEANGIWGQLENAIFADVDVEDLKVAVMGGPIFTEGDPQFRGVQLPKQFWKIIYFREVGTQGIQAKAYRLTQEDLLNELEALELPEFSVYEVPISHLTDLTGLRFDLSNSMPESLDRVARSPRFRADRTPFRRVRSVREIVRG